MICRVMGYYMVRNFKIHLKKFPSNEKGIGTSVLIISILLALVAGGIIGIGVTSLVHDQNDSPPVNDQTDVSYSEFQSLQRKVGLLENLLENRSGGTSGSIGSVDDLWLIDEIYESVKPSVVTIEVTTTSQGYFRTN